MQLCLYTKYRPQHLGHGFEALTLRFVALGLSMLAFVLRLTAFALILLALFPSLAVWCLSASEGGGCNLRVFYQTPKKLGLR